MLNAKQQRFVAEYLIDLNGKAAAIRAGYSPRSAETQASDLLKLPKVSEAVKEGQRVRLESNALSSDRVLEEMRRLAFSDLRNYFDDAGNLVPIKKLTAEQAAALASVEVVIKNVAAGDGQTDTIHKMKIWDKPKALEMLAKRFGLLIDRIEHSGEVAYRWAVPGEKID